MLDPTGNPDSIACGDGSSLSYPRDGAYRLTRETRTAAAMCAEGNVRSADLDAGALQARLEADGAVVRVPPEERRRARG